MKFDNIKNDYGNAFDYIKLNTAIIKPKQDSELTNREALWLSVFPATYVIGPADKESYFDIESKEQGFDRLVTKIQPFENKIFKNYLDNNYDETLNLRNWLLQIREGLINVTGCHFSHSIIASDMIKNNISRAIIFENDCKFIKNIPDSFLISLKNLLDTQDIPFLNLSPINKTNSTEIATLGEFKVITGNAAATHSYVMNLEIAHIVHKSTDINEPTLQSATGQFPAEQFARGGADDFFCGYVTNTYSLQPMLAYQQAIGGNSKII